MSKSKFSVLALFVVVGLIGLARFIFAAADFVPGAQPTGSIAPLAVTSFNLTSGNETVFQTDYERENWTGNVYAYPVTADGEIQTAAERWTDGAGSHIDQQNFDSGRKIVTMKSDGTKIPFRWASLDPAQQTQIGAQNVLNFVRGDRSLETVAGGFRIRASVLGDIIHSNPVYMKNGDSPVLFVGANDGMVHVFNASSGTGAGDELWAYVPSMLMSQLPALKASPYVHTYFVDGGLNLQDAVIGGVTKKILVGGLGAGGKGLFALDVTNPIPADEAAAAAKILWEITPTHINNALSNSYVNMGYTYGTPVIVPVNSGSGQSAVIIGNGYINTGNSRSSLFVINAADGTLIRELVVPTASPSGRGGLSTPGCIDTTSDGRADICYAGDIDGKLWKFDLTSTSAASWTVTLLHATNPAQAITTAPTVGVHPNGGFMVNFGTGRMFTAADAADTSVFYAYGIWDGAPAVNAVLLGQTLTEKSYVSAGVTKRVRVTSNNTPNWTSGAANHYGWRAALPAGERVLSDTIFIESGRFYFNSTNPTISNTSPKPNGENWLMELDFVTGGTINSPFLDLDSDQLLTNQDRIKYVSGDTIPAGSSVGSPIMTTAGIAVGKFTSNGVGSHPLLVQLATLNTTLFNQNPDVTFPPPPTSTERGVSGGHFDVDIFYGPKPSDICDYTYVGAVAGAKATGKVLFNWNGSKTITGFTISVGGETIRTGDPGSSTDTSIVSYIGAQSTTNYTVTVRSDTVTITATNTGTAFNNQPIVITATGITSSDYTITNLTGGVNTVGGVGTFRGCSSDQHFHQYDDKFNVTGVNMLNASSTTLNLSNAITSTATTFKVLVQNQYLSPAVALLVGTNPYQSVKVYNNLASETVAANVIANAPVYTRANITNLTFNMPTDAFLPKDWWGNGDVRVGLHPTVTGCVKSSNFGETLFNPVIPPANGTDGPGVNGTTTGVRHNGALTIQLIRADTPASAIELNVAGRPEYGWRVKNANFEAYVVAEYTVFWHHPNGKCYGAAGWVKAPPQQASSRQGGQTPAPGSDDPKIGSFSVTSATISITTTVSGNVTTTKTAYANKTTKTVTKTVNNDGTVTIVTQNPDGTSTTVTFANAKGPVAGGDEKGTQAKTGRISWSELLRK